jgi:hypothetical protein
MQEGLKAKLKAVTAEQTERVLHEFTPARSQFFVHIARFLGESKQIVKL